MANWKLRDYRNDLSTLIRLINSYKIPGDFQELNVLLSKLNDFDYIRYDFKNVCFHVKQGMSGTQPHNLNYFQIYFDNKIIQYYVVDENSDPLHGFGFDIQIHAYTSTNTSQDCYKSCWHIDQDYNTNRSNRYLHPSYHLQFGGDKIKAANTGNVAILPAPRIPHPPMDLFLGFHFILLNFFDKRRYLFVNLLLQNYEYEQMIKRAQERLWRPYFNSYIPTNTNTHFTFENVFPYYMQ